MGTSGGAWHIDAGPHVPLPNNAEWPADIPHPIFAIGAHIFLKDCNIEDGPTAVIPYSHLSGGFSSQTIWMIVSPGVVIVLFR